MTRADGDGDVRSAREFWHGGAAGDRHVLFVMGTRPEAIKLAPVVQQMRATSGLHPVVLSTGQHADMVTQALRCFGMRPDVDLGIGRPRQTLAGITNAALAGVAGVIEEIQPGAVVVQGDTTSSMAAALAAFYARRPVVHVEAGLRTEERLNPFPEEVNRRLTGVLADLHLAPTPQARANLRAVGVLSADILVTGNTGIDALLSVCDAGQPTGHGDLDGRLADRTRPVLLVTTHRRESWGAPMARTATAVAELARARPDLLVVIPIHPNPVVRDAVLPLVTALPNVSVIEPLDYAPFAALMARATVILTDSGGIQEEAPSLGKPVLVLRSTTERPEGVLAGTARLVGTDIDRITTETAALLDDPVAYAAMAQAHNPFGDGHAARRCVGAIEHLLGVRADLPAPFEPSGSAPPRGRTARHRNQRSASGAGRPGAHEIASPRRHGQDLLIRENTRTR